MKPYDIGIVSGQELMPDLYLVDGSLDFSGGVDSLKVTTVQSERNPNGLPRNELAWLINGTVRDGGILSRTGMKFLATLFDASAVYQGGGVYEPDFADPYLLISVSGHLYKLIPDFPVPVDLSAAFAGCTNPNTDAQFFGHYCQGEQFGIWQAGDYGQVAAPTLPLFWDGTILRRSKGITNAGVTAGTPGVNELPAAGPMDYYMGRLWYGQGRTLNAGDIVRGPSGTGGPGQYALRDSILNVTENPMVVGGDGFTVPTNHGNVRAIFHNANINAQLGQGQLMAGTPRAIYGLNVPVTRADWIAANNQNQPLMTVLQINNGPVSDRPIVKVNGDVFYQSLEPAIRSFFSSVRNFGQWGNIELSANMQRLLVFNDRSLLKYGNGAYFDNRLIMTALPNRKPQGTVHGALAVMDFIPLSTFGANLVPVWEGMYEGLDILQLFVLDFGGLERCFALAVSRDDGSIQLWELTNYLRSDFNNKITATNTDGEARITTVIEFPAYTWNREFELKKLETIELWYDKLFGEVIFKVEWRPDSDPCWKLWHEWKECSARNSCEDVYNPICYPIEQFRESYRATKTLPTPPITCASAMGRPAHTAYQHQIRLTIKGWTRLRGLLAHATIVKKATHANQVC